NGATARDVAARKLCSRCVQWRTRRRCTFRSRPSVTCTAATRFRPDGSALRCACRAIGVEKSRVPTREDYMKRREFLKAAGAGITASAVAAPAIAQSMPELRWRLTASWPKSLDTLYGAPDYMAKRIAELSDNKFHIQVFAAGEIVPGLQVLDAV